MKKLLTLILTTQVLLSCTTNDLSSVPDASNDKNVEIISGPTEFIGGYKAKAMVLGVFHFTNPGLDEY